MCNLNKIRPVYLRKCPYDHLFINKAYLGNITATNIYKSVTHKMAAKKTSWHIYIERNYVTVTLCILVYRTRILEPCCQTGEGISPWRHTVTGPPVSEALPNYTPRCVLPQTELVRESRTDVERKNICHLGHPVWTPIPNNENRGRISLYYDIFLQWMVSVNFYRGTSHWPVSVCPSVTSRCSTKTAKRRITRTITHDSPGL